MASFVTRALVVSLTVIGLVAVWNFAARRTSLTSATIIIDISTSRVTYTSASWTNAKLWSSLRFSVVVMSNGLVFRAIWVSNLPMSCVIVAFFVLLTSVQVASPSNVCSGAPQSSTTLSQLASIQQDPQPSMFDSKSSCSRVFLSRPVGRYSYSLNGGISTACRIRSSGLSIRAIWWLSDLRVLRVIIFSCFPILLILQCVSKSRY